MKKNTPKKIKKEEFSLKKNSATFLIMVLILTVVQIPAVMAAPLTLSPTADASIGGWWGDEAGKNYGDLAFLFTGGTYPNYDLGGQGGRGYDAYFKFDLPNTYTSDKKSITSAKLKLSCWGMKSWSQTVTKISFHKLASDSWTESGLNIGNVPIHFPADFDYIPSGGSYTFNNNTTIIPMEIDITDFIRSYVITSSDTTVSFAVTAAMADPGFYFASKENETVSYRPSLIIEAEDISAPVVRTAPKAVYASDEDVSIEFSNNMKADTFTTDAVTLLKSGTPVALTASDISVDGKIVKITAKKEPFETYTLGIANTVTDTFGTAIQSALEYPFNTVIGTTEATIKSFNSAVYDLNDDAGTGTYTHSGSGLLPYLYVGGVYRQYYAVVDISSLAGRSVSSVILKLFTSGRPNFKLYKLEGDFDPGVTTFSALPEQGEMFASYSQATDPNGYINIDVTNYVRELLLDGKTSLKFMLNQNESSQVSVANENNWSDGGWSPMLVAQCENVKYIALSESVPANQATGAAVDGDIELVLTADVNSVGASNVILYNNTDAQTVALTSEEIAFDANARKITVNPLENLKNNTSYTLTVSGLTADTVNQSKNISVTFTTEKEAVEIGEISLDKALGTAAVTVVKNTAEEVGGMTLIIAAYSGNRMTCVAVDSKQTLANGNNDFSATLSGLAGETDIRAFLWKLESQAPLKSVAQ